MATRQDVERLLRDIPLSTPADQSAAEQTLNIFVSLRNSAFEGGGISMPGTMTVFSVPALIGQMREGNYLDASMTLVTIAGDAAGAFSFLVTAGIEAGAIAGVGAMSSAGVVAGLAAEAAGPAVLAAAVLIETFRIPASVSENNAKLYFISDASGILTSWMFNMPEINPHSRLLARSRTGGYCRTDVSEHCRNAHERVRVLWQRTYQGNADSQRAARASARDSWEAYWTQVGAALERSLRPSPTGVGAAWIRSLISEANRSARRRTSDAAMREFEARQRRAAGGYWFRSADGVELFMPDR
jgi:hypothetical protein